MTGEQLTANGKGREEVEVVPRGVHASTEVARLFQVLAETDAFIMREIVAPAVKAHAEAIDRHIFNEAVEEDTWGQG